MSNLVLAVDHLHFSIGQKDILKGISFSIFHNEIVALIGESGSGKSMTASLIMGLAPSGSLQGKIYFQGKPLFLDSHYVNNFQGTGIGLILQDPGLALNPVIPLGKQLIEGICYHKKISKSEAWDIGVYWLSRVGIQDPLIRMKQYPYEMSGGMKQRILIAMALVLNPRLLIADEPTTALDVTMQLHILDILRIIQRKEKLSILFITHDLGVVAHCCDRVMVMQEGNIVEIGPVEEIFSNPQHPYTQQLLLTRKKLESFV